MESSFVYYPNNGSRLLFKQVFLSNYRISLSVLVKTMISPAVCVMLREDYCLNLHQIRRLICLNPVLGERFGGKTEHSY